MTEVMNYSELLNYTFAYFIEIKQNNVIFVCKIKNNIFVKLKIENHGN